MVSGSNSNTSTPSSASNIPTSSFSAPETPVYGPRDLIDFELNPYKTPSLMFIPLVFPGNISPIPRPISGIEFTPITESFPNHLFIQGIIKLQDQYHIPKEVHLVLPSTKD
ncbi:hypothetical protein ACH5RR_006647 [Cinchona calisaya]|uniref:Uncharacterized protein n=1 Tax=Cinchona calisaya TaxID=153742 RepID=A0ABD3APN2_9GENT